MDINNAVKDDELVTITNNKTKQVKQVRRRDLPQYNLPVDYISQADTFANSIKAGTVNPEQVPEAYRAGAMQSLNAQGYTPKTKIEKDREASKAKSLTDVQSFSSSIQNLKKQAQDATVTDTIASFLTGGNIGTDADIFDQSKKLLGQKIAKLYEGGRLSDKDRDFYQNEILKLSSVGRQSAIEKKLNNLETEILRAAGYTPEEVRGKLPENEKNPGFIENVERNIKDIGSGVAQLGGTVLQASQLNPNLESREQGQQKTKEMLTSLPGVMFQQGKQFVEDPVGYAYKNPVDVGLTFTGGASTLKGASLAGKAGKAGKAAKAGMSVDEALAKPSSAQNFVRQGVDLISGGGSKEFVKRQAQKGTTPQNQILLDEGILGNPTVMGQVQKAGESLKEVGEKISAKYEASDRHYKSDQLGTLLDDELKDVGYGQKDIEFIKKYLGQRGSFDLESGDNIITLNTAWKSAQKLENNPPKSAKGGAEYAAGYKELAKNAARIIRNDLAEKIDGIGELNQRYSAVLDFYDSKLPEVTKGALDVSDGMIKSVFKGIQAGAQTAGQAIYDPKKFIRDKRTKIGNVQFRGQQQIQKKKESSINDLNPTGGIYVKYDAASRATMPLGENITTLDKTMGKSGDEIITIYRGTTDKHNAINAGDFVTTNYDLAKDYAGKGNILEKKVRLGDVLDDVTDPLGEEYIYRPVIKKK